MIERELRLAAVDRAYRDHVADVYRMAYAILREVRAVAGLLGSDYLTLDPALVP